MPQKREQIALVQQGFQNENMLKSAAGKREVLLFLKALRRCSPSRFTMTNT